MSFLIDWELLKDGTEAEQLKDFLNEKFSSIERPNFLGPITIKSFSFGSIPPDIAVKSISDPMEEFYFDQEDVNYDSQSNFEGIGSSLEPNQERSETDAQLEISISYKGNLNMTISTELIINQPTAKFMTLPLTLTLTNTSFHATAIIAYIGNTVNFCLKEQEGSETQGILREFSIESAIGDGNKQVLKNVGKIEKFILQQLSTFLNDYIVHPNFHTILLQPDEA